MTPTVSQVIRNLVTNPNLTFNMDGDTIIDWDTSNTGIAQPTQSAIDAELARLQAVYDGKAYQRTRAAAYPELKEQLDLLYKDMLADKGDKTGTWFAAVKAVKDATAKPE
jgi:hypothetical protein